MDQLYSYRIISWLAWRAGLSVCSTILCFALLSACSPAATPPQPLPTPLPAALRLPGEVLDGLPPANEVTIAGYLVTDTSGARLLGSILFDANGVPRPLATGVEPIWLGVDAAKSFPGNLRTAGELHYAAVSARGRLEGPGVFGPVGYPYQLLAPDVQPLAIQETTVADLLDQPSTYTGQMVRVLGGLLVRDNAALLVDRLGPGGVPVAKARQIKLSGSLRDQALLDRLKGAPGGAVRFGQVQVEGVLRGGVLMLLSITLIT
jgi:hypothetical protein